MEAFGGVATTIPAGRLSKTFKPVAGTNAPELLTVNVMAKDVFKARLGDAKDLAKPGIGAAVIANAAEEVPLFPKEDVSAEEVFVWPDAALA